MALTITLNHVNEIKEHLLYILSTNDDEWKSNVLGALVKNSIVDISPDLLSALQRIAENPTKGEVLEEVDIKAREILAERY